MPTAALRVLASAAEKYLHAKMTAIRRCLPALCSGIAMGSPSLIRRGAWVLIRRYWQSTVRCHLHSICRDGYEGAKLRVTGILHVNSHLQASSLH